MSRSPRYYHILLLGEWFYLNSEAKRLKAELIWMKGPERTSLTPLSSGTSPTGLPIPGNSDFHCLKIIAALEHLKIF